MSFEAMNIVLVNSNGSVVSGTTEGPTYYALISDDNGNPPGGGASITVSTSGDCELLSPSSAEVPDTNTPEAFEVKVITGGEGGKNGESGEDGYVLIAVTNGGITVNEEFGCASLPPPDPNETSGGGLTTGG